MCPVQKKIIDAFKNDAAPRNRGDDITTTMHGLYDLLPDEKRGDIDLAIVSWEGVSFVDGQIVIPATYFEE